MRLWAARILTPAALTYKQNDISWSGSAARNLEPYTRGRQILSGQLQSLAQLINDDPVQARHFAQLQQLLDQRQQQMAHALELHGAGGYQGALTFVATNRGYVTRRALRTALLRRGTIPEFAAVQWQLRASPSSVTELSRT